jgi:hypothetical protein
MMTAFGTWTQNFNCCYGRLGSYSCMPDKPQSGMGHAIPTNSTLFEQNIKDSDVITEQLQWNPVDCVKLAVNEILKRKPDLCFWSQPWLQFFHKRNLFGNNECCCRSRIGNSAIGFRFWILIECGF